MGNKKNQKRIRAKADSARDQMIKQSAADLATRQQAVARLAKAMKFMGEPPEDVLSLFERLGISWEKLNLRWPGSGDDKVEPCLVVRWQDLLDGEDRNQEQGSVLKRLYGHSGTAMDINTPNSQPPGGYTEQSTKQARSSYVDALRGQAISGELNGVRADDMYINNGEPTVQEKLDHMYGKPVRTAHVLPHDVPVVVANENHDGFLVVDKRKLPPNTHNSEAGAKITDVEDGLDDEEHRLRGMQA